MADQLAAEVVDRVLVTLAPLRRVSSARRAVGSVIEKAPTIASARYLAAVRELPCHFCAAPGPSDPHHFPPRGSRGRNDLLVLPVCRTCHDDAQQNKIDVIDQAAAVHATQALLFRLRGALWWVGVFKEIGEGME